MVYEPRGVAAVLTPWNDRVAISAAQHLAANLAVGNVVIFEPSERTPLAAGPAVAPSSSPGDAVLGDP